MQFISYGNLRNKIQNFISEFMNEINSHHITLPIINNFICYFRQRTVRSSVGFPPGEFSFLLDVAASVFTRTGSLVLQEAVLVL